MERLGICDCEVAMDTLLKNANPQPFFGKPFTVQNLLCDISPQTEKTLDKIKQRKIYRQNECIFSTGEPPKLVYFLIDGSARLFLNTKEKSHCIVRTVNSSEILGLPESISNFPYETGIETLSRCVCECIDREDFLDFLGKNEKICFRVFRMLASNLQNSYENFSATAFPNILQYL